MRGLRPDSIRQRPTFDVAAALGNTNSTEYALLLRDMDAIAAQLKKFSSNNIPVLWRPLARVRRRLVLVGRARAGSFQAALAAVVHRLTAYHGLHNLIWVLSSEDPAWYPGDDVVDVVGVDAYPTDPTDPVSARWQALLSRFTVRS